MLQREGMYSSSSLDVGWGLWAINNVMTPGLRCLLSCIDFIQRAGGCIDLGFSVPAEPGEQQAGPEHTCVCKMFYQSLLVLCMQFLSSSGVFAQVPV